MPEPGPRLAAWLGTVADLLQQPLTEMPHEVIFEHLEQTFAVTAVSHNWSSLNGQQGATTRPHDALLPLSASMESWQRGDMRDCHPLISWHDKTGDTRPWTNGRVPTALVPMHKRSRVVEPLRTLELDQQLSSTYQLHGSSYRTYALGRGSHDFSDEDLMVAHYVQRAVSGLYRQTVILSSLVNDRKDAVQDEAGLSGRELAVLSLLADGLPTRLIARRLGLSKTWRTGSTQCRPSGPDVRSPSDCLMRLGYRSNGW